MEKDEKKWQVLHSEYLISRPWLTARRDHVRLPNGAENKEYYVLEYPDWVNVIAITAEGKFIMERQYRHGLQWTGYEICAGVCEKGETPLQSAQRELYEETLENCDEVVVLSAEYYPGCMYLRNRYMVDNADVVIAHFNGAKGGTMYTLSYAKKNKKSIIII